MSATNRRISQQAVAFLTIALVATACTTTSSESGRSSPQSVAPATTIPDTPVGAEAQWVLETLEADSGPSAQQAEERFTDAFLAQVPADQVPASFDQLRPLGPFAVEWYEGAVPEVMSIDPGVATDGWPYVGFKGGSGPGVLALSWYVEDAAGIPHSLVIQLAADDPTATADVEYVSDLAAQGIALLGEE